MKRFLLLVTVAIIGLVAGAVVTGRPQTVTRDVRAGDIRTTTPTVPPPSTQPPTTRPRPTTTTTTSTSSTTTSTTEPPAPATTEPAPATTERETTTTRPPTTTIATTEPPTTPAPTTSTTPPLAPIAETYVMVGNASNTFGLATQTAAALRDLGYEFVYRADGVREVRESRVYYSENFEGEATRLAESIGLDASRVQPRPSQPLTNGTQEFQVLLLLGNDWSTVTALGTMVDVEPPGPTQSLLQRPQTR